MGDLFFRITGVRSFDLMKKSFLAFQSNWSTLDTGYPVPRGARATEDQAASSDREAATRR